MVKIKWNIHSQETERKKLNLDLHQIAGLLAFGIWFQYVLQNQKRSYDKPFPLCFNLLKFIKFQMIFYFATYFHHLHLESVAIEKTSFWLTPLSILPPCLHIFSDKSTQNLSSLFYLVLSCCICFKFLISIELSVSIFKPLKTL